MRLRELLPAMLSAVLTSLGCSDADEPSRVELAVVEDRSGIQTATTNLGYEVALVEARLALADLLFATAGESHTASLWERAVNLVVPTAHAHPGHFQGGDVTGELRGRFVVGWLDGEDATLGMATLLCGPYRSADFTFGRAQVEDGVAPGDPLVGHTAVLRGTATRAGVMTSFVAVIDSPEDRQLVGAPFELEVTERSTERLGLRLLMHDPLSEGTLFDDVDFDTIAPGDDGQVRLVEASADAATANAYFALRRTFQTHDHFDVRPIDAAP